MTNSRHLWAIGYDDMGRANQVREEITSLGWVKHGLIWIRAARNINRGEELSYDYNTTGNAEIACRCRPDCKSSL